MFFDWLALLIALALVLITAIFVASEFSLVSLDRSGVDGARRGFRTRVVSRALSRVSTHLSGAQLGITLCSLLIGYLADLGFTGLLQPLRQSPFSWSTTLVSIISSVVAISVATLVSLLFGELIPKNLALARPLSTARLVIPFQSAFTAVFYPAIRLLNGVANIILRRFNIEAKEELSSARSPDELSSLVRRSRDAGSLAQSTAILLDRTLHFQERTAAEVMTPWSQVASVSSDATAADVLRSCQITGYSRFPVLAAEGEGSLPLGIATINGSVRIARELWAETSVLDLLLEVEQVPETMRLDSLLPLLRSGVPFAFVVDEYGDRAGIITLEDLVEELVGEIADEHDPEPDEVVHLARDEVAFSGLLRPDEILQRASVGVPESDSYETVGGYIMSRLERIPEVGDRVPVPSGALVVLSMDGLRVDRVRYLPESCDSQEGARV